jgi:hypothetical protein
MAHVHAILQGTVWRQQEGFYTATVLCLWHVSVSGMGALLVHSVWHTNHILHARIWCGVLFGLTWIMTA